MKHIVLFVEGQGDVKAVPVLIRRLITDQNGWNNLSIDENPFEIGSVNNIVKENYSGWKRKLKSCLKKENTGGVPAILDGDIKKVSGKDFCAAEVAKSLADAAKEVGAGKIFSVAIVFAVQEYETWLVAGIESLAGKKLPDGRSVNARAKAPDGDLEVNPRNAKGALGTIIEGGYDQVLDQAILTQLIDIDIIRSRKLRSFQRLESALSSLIEAIRRPHRLACLKATKDRSSLIRDSHLLTFVSVSRHAQIESAAATSPSDDSNKYGRGSVANRPLSTIDRHTCISAIKPKREPVVIRYAFTEHSLKFKLEAIRESKIGAISLNKCDRRAPIV